MYLGFRLPMEASARAVACAAAWFDRRARRIADLHDALDRKEQRSARLRAAKLPPLETDEVVNVPSAARRRSLPSAAEKRRARKDAAVAARTSASSQRNHVLSPHGRDATATGSTAAAAARSCTRVSGQRSRVGRGVKLPISDHEIENCE